MTSKEVRESELEGRRKVPATLKEYFGTEEIYVIFTHDQYNPVDFYANSPIFNVVGEVKNYKNERSFFKFEDYLIDWGKVICIKAEALSQGKIPLLICYFTDYTVIWDLTNIDLDKRRDWEWVNKDGQNYGKEKEYNIVTHLLPSEASWIKEVS